MNEYGMISPPPRRKRHRVFLWSFLAVQAVFVILIIVYATESTGPSHADLVSGCYHGAWSPLFSSQADCVKHYGGALNAAGHVGQGIGIVLVIALWVAADVILGVGRLVVVTSRRRSS
jgi:hypothetical protein